jgi:hypothetical protein
MVPNAKKRLHSHIDLGKGPRFYIGKQLNMASNYFSLRNGSMVNSELTIRTGKVVHK